jgi:murein DD-endopeptidase MepM/ murein hydrolase activator NlpD
MRGIHIFIALSLLTAPASAPARAEGTTCKPATATRLNTVKPLSGNDYRMVATFGMRRSPILGSLRMHEGIDWAAPRGTPVVAAASGLVAYTGFKADYGNTVIIDHGNGLETVYAHLSAIAVHLGDCIDAGTNIGAAGSTGQSSSMGVHFEVRRDGKAVDPMLEPVDAKGAAGTQPKGTQAKAPAQNSAKN